MASAIFKHTNGKIYHKILSKKVFNPGLNVYIFRSKLQLVQKIWTNPHSLKACMVTRELFQISTSFPTVQYGPPWKVTQQNQFYHLDEPRSIFKWPLNIALMWPYIFTYIFVIFGLPGLGIFIWFFHTLIWKISRWNEYKGLCSVPNEVSSGWCL